MKTMAIELTAPGDLDPFGQVGPGDHVRELFLRGLNSCLLDLGIRAEFAPASATADDLVIVGRVSVGNFDGLRAGDAITNRGR
jgi:ribosome biogenesis SPOUT family RNA methylase Rps3